MSCCKSIGKDMNGVELSVGVKWYNHQMKECGSIVCEDDCLKILVGEAEAPHEYYEQHKDHIEVTFKEGCIDKEDCVQCCDKCENR